jgi:hypothetical protein
MLTTGREYDRALIAVVIMALILMTIYVWQCDRKHNRSLQAQQKSMTARVDLLSTQVQETANNLKDFITPIIDETEVEVPKVEMDPSPVSSSFLN